MRVPREVKQVAREGASLSADDAAALERALEERPDDVHARVRLLGYYRARAREAHRTATPEERRARVLASWARGRWSEDRPDQARHALWLAANAPRAPVHGLWHFRRDEPAFAELAAIWRRHADADPADATLLAHAIAFFWWENEAFADELLARAETAFPADARWARFRQDRRAHALFEQHMFEPLRDRGMTVAGAESTPDDRDTRLRGRLADIERLLGEGDPQSEWAPRLREAAAHAALALGEVERARTHAEQLLASDAGVPAPEHSDNAHNGHLLLGRIALRREDVERAKAHLILAGRAGATGLVRNFGPDLRLAHALLVRGERDVVIRYLTLCRTFWQRGSLDEWVAEIRAGGIPDFGRNLQP